MVEYGEAWYVQKRFHLARSRDEIPDLLLLLQHPHVYTLGRRTSEFIRTSYYGNNLPQLPVYHSDRGGGATYHGPGQIVGYPILKLSLHTRDYYHYLRMLEEVIIRTLKDFCIHGERREGLTGVWTDKYKIASIGIRIIKGITMHGFALNVNNDLSYLQYIIPCNMKDIKITSMERLLQRRVLIEEVEDRLIYHFEKIFNLSQTTGYYDLCHCFKFKKKLK